jgi:hypothetical protein
MYLSLSYRIEENLRQRLLTLETARQFYGYGE